MLIRDLQTIYVARSFSRLLGKNDEKKLEFCLSFHHPVECKSFCLTSLRYSFTLNSIVRHFRHLTFNIVGDLKWNTSDPWKSRDEVPKLDVYQEWEGELLNALEEERSKRRRTRRSSIPEDVEELRKQVAQLAAENKSLRVQVEILDSLVSAERLLYLQLLDRMGVPMDEQNNPYSSYRTDVHRRIKRRKK